MAILPGPSQNLPRPRSDRIVSPSTGKGSTHGESGTTYRKFTNWLGTQLLVDTSPKAFTAWLGWIWPKSMCWLRQPCTTTCWAHPTRQRLVQPDYARMPQELRRKGTYLMVLGLGGLNATYTEFSFQQPRSCLGWFSWCCQSLIWCDILEPSLLIGCVPFDACASLIQRLLPSRVSFYKEFLWNNSSSLVRFHV
jgi:hypothetical protein